MKFPDKIWNMLGLVDTEDTDVVQPVPADKTTVRPERNSERMPNPAEVNKPRWTPPTESVSPVSGTTLAVKTNSVPIVATELVGGKCQLAITQPMGFDDARQIAENVTNGKSVVVNFERTDAETTKRTVDFMSGITYAVGGTVQRISSTVFLFAPSQVEVFSSERFADDVQAMLPWRKT